MKTKQALTRFFLGILIVIFLSPVVFWLADRLFPLPSQTLTAAQVVVADNGEPLWRFADKDGIWRYPVTLEQVPTHFIQALLTYEDRHFYQHWGVNPLSMMRAAWQWVKYGHIVSGGSTITMQVARLISPHEKTILGKMQQIFRALQLEWYYSKDEILTMYLNRAPYGGTLEGIGAASWAYLGKSPKALLPAESALLAVLPQAPSRLRPDRHPQRAEQARNKVLDRLASYQTWPIKQIEEIRQEAIWLAPRKNPHLAPLLARRLRSKHSASIIQTTVDAALQQTLEEMALNWQYQLPPKTSVGVMVVDHQTMAVKAYLGSVNFNDKTRFGHVDMLGAWRSPGSTLKPFIFGFALDEGLIHSASLLQDVPRIQSDYRPQNFDTGFYGPVSASEALTRSLNLPAVQLMEAYGAKRFAAKLANVGISLRSIGQNEPNLAYILGGVAVKMDDLLAAYSAFTRQGKSAQLRFLVDAPLEERRLMSSGAAWIVRRMLGREGQPQPGQALSPIAPFAWKTGTSYGYRDAWAIGMTPRYLIGIWVGRPDGTPVSGQYGNASAVPLLNQVHQVLLQREANHATALPSDPQPDVVSAQSICWPLGQPLAKDDINCHRRLWAWTLDNMTPQTLSQRPHDIDIAGGRQTIWLNPQGLRVAPDCEQANEQQIVLWPIALEPWLSPKEKRDYLLPPIDPQCPTLGGEQVPALIMLGIKSNQWFSPLPGRKQVSISVNSRGGKGQRWWFLNGDWQVTTKESARWTLTLSQKGKYQLLVMDEAGQIDRMTFYMR